MRLRRSEDRDHSGQCGLSAGPYIHGLGSEPDGIDANHWARQLIKHAQPSGSEAGHLTVMDGCAGNCRSALQAFLDDLGFERFRVRASLAHENPGDKGNRVRLKIRGYHRP